MLVEDGFVDDLALARPRSSDDELESAVVAWGAADVVDTGFEGGPIDVPHALGGLDLVDALHRPRLSLGRRSAPAGFERVTTG